MSAPNPTRQKEGWAILDRLFADAENLWIIHYSCESFYDRPEGRSPRITSIALRKLSSAQTTSFSIHQTEPALIACLGHPASIPSLMRYMSTTISAPGFQGFGRLPALRLGHALPRGCFTSARRSRRSGIFAHSGNDRFRIRGCKEVLGRDHASFRGQRGQKAASQSRCHNILFIRSRSGTT